MTKFLLKIFDDISSFFKEVYYFCYCIWRFLYYRFKSLTGQLTDLTPEQEARFENFFLRFEKQKKKMESSNNKDVLGFFIMKTEECDSENEKN